jgi:hypothetical protein
MTTNTPELTILNRLVQIPLVASSLQTVHSTLQANRLTATPYATATAVSAYALGTANKYSAPIQTRLAPLVVCADGYANAAVDAVEARYPYPFHASADEVCQDLTARSEGVKGVANKTIDDRVCAPAGRIIASIDQASHISPPVASPISPPVARTLLPYYNVVLIRTEIALGTCMYAHANIRLISALLPSWTSSRPA